MSCFFNFTRSFSFQIFISEPAAQTVLPVTIFLLELEQRLRVRRRRNRQPCPTPHTDDMIVLRLQCFEKTCGAVAKSFIRLVYSISIKKRNDGIDEKQVQGILAHTLFPAWRSLCKRKMLFPIGRELHSQYLLHVFRCFHRHNAGKQ